MSDTAVRHRIPTEAPIELRRGTAQPTLWALLIAVGGALGFFAIAIFSPDWGEAARQSTWLATALGVVCILTGLLYLLAGARRYWLVWLVVGVALAVLGLYELPTAVVPLHLLQAREAEAAGHYDQAYMEWRLAGYGKCDPHVTGALLRWARTDRDDGHYGDALIRLRRLVRDCSTDPTARQAVEAASDQIGTTELAYGEQLVSTGDYADAIAQFHDVEAEYRTTPLAPAARQNAAAAYMAWADSEEHAGRYASALAKYQAILSQYPDSAFATSARNGAAQALYDWGQWDTRNAHYAEAVQHYNQLVDEYPGTPQADEATTLLHASQMVVGRLTHNDGSAASGVRVRLSSEWQFGGGTYTTGGAQYTAQTDATGIFTFGAVPPGPYLLEWTGPDGRYTTFISVTGQPENVVTVPRLHPLTLGNINIDPTDP